MLIGNSLPHQTSVMPLVILKSVKVSWNQKTWKPCWELFAPVKHMPRGKCFSYRMEWNQNCEMRSFALALNFILLWLVWSWSRLVVLNSEPKSESPGGLIPWLSFPLIRFGWVWGSACLTRSRCNCGFRAHSVGTTDWGACFQDFFLNYSPNSIK